MAYSKVDDMKTCVIEMNIHCDCYGCQEKLKGYRKIRGVKSVDVDNEEKKVTILIIGDPKKVKEKLKKQKKAFDLCEQSLPIKKIHDRHMVAQQPALEVDKSIVKKTQGCSPEHGGSGGINIWRTTGLFVSTIAACLLGDPTGVLVPLFLGCFIKSIPMLLRKKKSIAKLLRKKKFIPKLLRKKNLPQSYSPN